MNLEHDPSTSLRTSLKRVLRRQAPPPGFAGRVMQKIERDRGPQRNWWRAVAASLTLTAILGGWSAHVVQKRREGERAKEQVLLALRIAGEKVRIAQDEVRDIGSNE